MHSPLRFALEYLPFTEALYSFLFITSHSLVSNTNDLALRGINTGSYITPETPRRWANSSGTSAMSYALSNNKVVVLSITDARIQ